MKMAVLTRDELTNMLADRFADTEDENDIAFMENITDTFDDLQTNANATQLRELQDRYSALQKKYRDRFFNSSGSDSDDEDLVKPTSDPEPKIMKFDDLFTQGV